MILDLILGLENIPEATEPNGAEEVRPGEDVKGMLSLRARKLWTLISKQVDLTNVKILAGPPSDPAETEVALNAILADKKRTNMLEKLFWQEVCEELGGFEGNISIRKGWQVVLETKTDEETEAETIMGAALSSPMIAALVGRLSGECNCQRCTARRAASTPAAQSMS